jgi:hypothetical protein
MHVLHRLISINCSINTTGVVETSCYSVAEVNGVSCVVAKTMSFNGQEVI